MPHRERKLAAGSTFPSLKVPCADGTTHDLANIKAGRQWKLIVVFRGGHCELDHKHINKWGKYYHKIKDLGADIVAVSADTQDEHVAHSKNFKVSFPVCYGLSLSQMRKLGLYITERKNCDREPDHPYAEPALFVLNSSGRLHVVSYSNNPFCRVDVEKAVAGLEYAAMVTTHPRGTYREDLKEARRQRHAQGDEEDEQESTD